MLGCVNADLGSLLGLVLRQERESLLKAKFSPSPRAGGGRGEEKSLICRGGRGQTGRLGMLQTHLVFTARILQRGNTTSWSKAASSPSSSGRCGDREWSDRDVLEGRQSSHAVSNPAI